MALVRTKTPLRKEFTGDRQIDGAQDHAADAHRVLNATPFTPARGVLLQGKTLASGKETVLVHGLGRIPSGCFPALATKAAWRGYVTARTTTTITVFQENGFVDPIVDMWVF